MLVSARRIVVMTIVLSVCGFSHLSFGRAKDSHGTETVLWNFGHDSDGADPNGRLIFDASGNMFGTTGVGGPIVCLTATMAAARYSSLALPPVAGLKRYCTIFAQPLSAPTAPYLLQGLSLTIRAISTEQLSREVRTP
jgi:hypothetical protein